MSERRELYRSANGDAWFLGREPADGGAFIIHQSNAPSGDHTPRRRIARQLGGEPAMTGRPRRWCFQRRTDSALCLKLARMEEVAV